MAVVDALATVALTVVLPPFIMVLVSVLVLASLGKSLGLRQRYVQFLLKVFEFGRQRLSKNYGKGSGDEQEEEEEEEDYVSREVICRDKLVLRPTVDKDNSEGLDTHEFELGDCLDYIRTGMEAIVDDEVTKRFSAEELTSWNFLTRTNCQYEFISVRLTIFWVVGFILRYFLLLPLRILILLIGMAQLVVMTLLIGMLPDGPLKRNLCWYFYITTFRILNRSLSCVVTYHNRHNKPRSDGICVANHTTPIDCLVLAYDNCYSYMVVMVACTYVVGCLPESKTKRRLNSSVSVFCFDFLSGALSLVCTYHNKENVPRRGICVANHTTPIDVLVLACDNTYDMVGQRHGGFLGIFQRALSRASAHIWFERSESKDRFAVARRLREHVEDPDKLPILIFPEGTCINNTSVMQFKKGTFEVGGIIYPVAIKYDPRFGDAFWNSSKESMLSYIYMMMTSWAIVCDVWYLPPMTRREGESSIDFANRVKAEIARQGGLVDLVWDGGLKRSAPKIEWKQQYQQEFSRRLKVQNVDTAKKEEKTE
ncbi:glycerol-3-phosphate acyltransferase 4-like isoform X2 [Eriocheir sinensis]|uniref:glycerol-3-phosphate acyltransferase 4-like isoform X2 n=1 Tax=Eriocheir sinensis TaxID=95602 RepID=UPI0021C76CD3|nr:glycerol-3-phosphate acyltransferase 4-like isoform X2 [Eriocheir sinensis]